MKLRLLLAILLISCTPKPPGEVLFQPTPANVTSDDLAILVLPTKVAPEQKFTVTWEVPLDTEYKTGILYDSGSRKSDYYAYEFVSALWSDDTTTSFSTEVVAFDAGAMFLRPFATSNGRLYYGEEVAVPIS